jgi:hypothetical protein
MVNANEETVSRRLLIALNDGWVSLIGYEQDFMEIVKAEGGTDNGQATRLYTSIIQDLHRRIPTTRVGCQAEILNSGVALIDHQQISIPVETEAHRCI